MLEHLLTHGFDAPVLAETTMRVATGAFFAISGYHKLFNPTRHQTILDTMKSLGIPYPRFNSWWVPSVEFFGGLAVTFGFLGPIAAAGLITICLVAVCTDGIKRIVSWKPIDPADEVDDVLYLPETLYIFLLSLVILGGSGPYSLDHWFFG